MGSVVLGIDLQRQSSFDMYLSLLDGNGEEVFNTEQAVMWLTPEGLTWEDAGRVQVISVFNPQVRKFARIAQEHNSKMKMHVQAHHSKGDITNDYLSCG